MGYEKRIDGRGFKETRPIEAKVGVIEKADGSAYFKIGKTWAYAAVYGPRELLPKSMQNPKTGILRVNYNMLPFSGVGERVRPGPSRRSREISMVSEAALLPVLDLEAYPNTVVDVFIELPQTDAGSRAAGICAASMALADAGLEMKDLVGAIAVGKVDDKIVVDLQYEEEAYKEGEVADIPIAMIPSTGEITLLQMDGPIKREELIEAIKIAKDVIKDIVEIQRKAIKDKYKGMIQ
ncbi:exosome complex exonuclease Rrp41 [Candidatus Woesearchaeota archaeon]|nr:exosome complex exonuclease Rrp41 [Candidatus Woesearchaeota archaeon]